MALPWYRRERKLNFTSVTLPVPSSKPLTGLYKTNGIEIHGLQLQHTSSSLTSREVKCDAYHERRCKDGTCIPRKNLCPEEELVNRNTVMIMIVVGVAVTILVIVLYCIQQKRQSRNTPANANDVENERFSFNFEPPTYEEVVTTNLYPPTPHTSINSINLLHGRTMPPPPNYDMALQILSRSHGYLNKKTVHFPVNRIERRSVSVDHILSKNFRDWSPPPPITPLISDAVFFSPVTMSTSLTADSKAHQSISPIIKTSAYSYSPTRHKRLHLNSEVQVHFSDEVFQENDDLIEEFSDTDNMQNQFENNQLSVSEDGVVSPQENVVQKNQSSISSTPVIQNESISDKS